MSQRPPSEDDSLSLLGKRLAELEEAHFEERVSGLESRLGTSDGSNYRLRDLDEDKIGYDLKNIIIMARASVLSYRSQEEINRRLEVEKGDSHTHGWLEDPGTDTQAFWYQTKKSLIFVFRGTSGAVDVVTDVKRHPVQISIAGQSVMEAHQGFAQSAKTIWPAIKERIDANPGYRLWFTGHSLGGALATLTAYLAHSSCKSNPIAGLYTIGQPRVLRDSKANRAFSDELGPDRIFRVYRSIDPVPHMPWLGYRHISGNRCYIKKSGKFVYKAHKWKVVLDRAHKLLRVIHKIMTTMSAENLKALVADHFSQGYLDDLNYTRSLQAKPPAPPLKVQIRQAYELLTSKSSINRINFDEPPDEPKPDDAVTGRSIE